jgi:transposase InsO family protein
VVSDRDQDLARENEWLRRENRILKEERDLAIRALKMAVALRQPLKGRLHHADRGSQYRSHGYQKLLRQRGFQVSMSGKGNCYVNSVVEAFFKIIRAELIWRRSWPTSRAAELVICEYINGF